MDLTYWALFAGTVIAVSMIPGPSTLIAFSHGASHGWLRSTITASGNAAASACQAIAASAGLGLVLTGSATLFLTLKYAGAAYLVYVGIQLWRSAARRVSLSDRTHNLPEPARKLFAGGFTVAASNPKAIAFFTALFPQFLSPEGTGVGQLAGMVAVVCLSAFAVATVYGGLGAWLRRLELSRRAVTRIHKTTGGIFVASGIGLAASRSG
ncbi:lysine transporter LysE [Rhodovulum viride]|uniref:Lysine transporter LysE n=1 Tax=Rhodovulum viride TaxID=1231134 RepID=A0ABX9DLB1_9RHOB|nr:LysE family translocator [Rhodovulum viride]RAP42067.1 lysine transporter LysE [Rhodovulum viride]